MVLKELKKSTRTVTNNFLKFSFSIDVQWIFKLFVALEKIDTHSQTHTTNNNRTMVISLVTTNNLPAKFSKLNQGVQ